MNPVNPINELNVEGLLNRWFEAADNLEENSAVKDKLYADTKQVTSTIMQLIRNGRTEEAKKLAEIILNSFESSYKHKSEDPNRLIDWISRNSTNEGDKVFGDKLKGAHKYFHSLFSALNIAEVNLQASTKDFKNTLSELDKIDVSAKDRIPLKNVNIAAIAHNSMFLAEYAVRRVKPFFEISVIDSQPQVNLFGNVQSPKGDMPVPLQKKHLKDNFYVRDYLEEFLQESVANKDLTIESALNILLDLNYLAGIKDIIFSKKGEFLNEKLLDLDKILKMGPEYIKIFMDYLPDSTLQYCFVQAQINGDIDTQTLLISKKIPITSDQKELYERQKNWFEGNAEAQFPALKQYNTERQIFTKKHEQWYFNNQKGQKFFLEETRKSVKFALFEMNEWKYSNADAERKFENLLTSLGFRRGCIAYQSESREPEQFGRKREKFHRIQVDRYGQVYVDRIKDLMANGTSNVAIGKNIITEYKFHISGDMSNIDANYYTKHEFPFWSFEKGLFGCIARLFDGIIKKENPTPEDLRVDIANFHWWMANLIPFDRGSASITEVLTDALWLMHGFVPQRNLEKGKAIDMEAILAPSLHAFRQIYPSAIDVRSQNNTNDSQIVIS